METYEPDDTIAVISPWGDGNAFTTEKVSCFYNNDGRKQTYNISYPSRQAMVVAVGYNITSLYSNEVLNKCVLEEGFCWIVSIRKL